MKPVENSIHQMWYQGMTLRYIDEDEWIVISKIFPCCDKDACSSQPKKFGFSCTGEHFLDSKGSMWCGIPADFGRV